MAEVLELGVTPQAADRAAARQRRDDERGYRINVKLVGIAIAAEAFIIVASLVGAWLFARQYGGGDAGTMTMMMLAPISYAVIELCRVPLALAIRTQRSLVIRIIATIGVIGAASVTIKSMSQLGELMFRPRLHDVTVAKTALSEARAEEASIRQRIADADAVVAQRVTQLAETEKRVTQANTELGGLPAQKCWRVASRTREGRRITSQRCNTDPRIDAMKASLSLAGTDRDAASRRLDEARTARAGLDRAPADRKLADADVAYRDAVMRSQLHSFAAMVFAREPGEITDRQIHIFLFFFVFVPAIGASLAATLLALVSVERIDPDDIRLDDEAGGYILGPFADEIVREATEAAEKAANAALEKSRPAAQPGAVTGLRVV